MNGDVRIDRGALAAFVNAPDGYIARDLARRAIAVDTEATRLVHQAGGGRTYRLSNPTRVHRASAPGQPPATDLGMLAASITWALGRDAKGLFAVVGSGLRKARWLELGTRRMAARPFLRPALRKAGR